MRGRDVVANTITYIYTHAHYVLYAMFHVMPCIMSCNNHVAVFGCISAFGLLFDCYVEHQWPPSLVRCYWCWLIVHHAFIHHASCLMVTWVDVIASDLLYSRFGSHCCSFFCSFFLLVLSSEFLVLASLFSVLVLLVVFLFFSYFFSYPCLVHITSDRWTCLFNDIWSCMWYHSISLQHLALSFVNCCTMAKITTEMDA